MATPKSVAFYTLGCKLNYSESSSIARAFEKEGYFVNKFEDGADIQVINTCSVTDFADKKCRQIVRRSLRKNPNAFIIVTGCYAQLKPEEIANIPGVDLVLGAGEKFKIIEYVNDLTKASGKGLVQAGKIESINTFTNAFSFGDRTRSFLKIQDGCDYKCTFCTIPRARGASRSDTLENVLKNARIIADKKVKEIVLTGVNIGDFGLGTGVIEGTRKKKQDMFFDLIKKLDYIEEIERFRISSIEPNLLTHEIIDFVASSKRFVPHFHIPLQSGSNRILSLMKRRYKRDLYADRIAKINAIMPHCCIGVDVIIGFPGETEEAFMETYHFLQELDISYLHVFTYSERPNTEAFEMKDVVPKQERKRRNEMLTILSEKKKRAFYTRFIGQERKVLFENSKKEGIMTGFTDNYIKIETPLITEMINQVSTVKLSSLNSETVMAAELLKVQLP